MPVEIDFCVAMQGPNVDLLGCIFLKSMRRVVEFDTPLQRVRLHVIDNGIPDDALPGVRNLLGQMPCETRLHDVRGVDWGLRTGHNETDVSRHVASNTAAVCEWMLDNCGASEWCCISHFDLFWKLDMVANMSRRVRPEVGMFGKHDPIMMIRRRAWRQCRVPLRDVASYYAVPWENGVWRVRHESDRRAANSGRIFLGGFDVAELFEMALPGYGWVHEALEEEFDAHLYHFRSGSGYHGEPTNASVRQRAHDLVASEGF